jgi:phosphatidylglycerophosphatase A
LNKKELNKIESRDRTPLWASAIAAVGGIGKIKPGPGTWGSAVAVLLWVVISRLIPSDLHTVSLVVLSLVVIGIGIPAATEMVRTTGSKDPQSVVIDEVAGQWITLIAVPVAWKSLLVGFILFRGFDILKPPPIRRIEALRDGFGIVLDDVAAGLYALILMHLFLHLGWS